MADLTDYELGLAIARYGDARFAHLNDPADVERVGAAMRPALEALVDAATAMAEIIATLDRDHPELVAELLASVPSRTPDGPT